MGRVGMVTDGWEYRCIMGVAVVVLEVLDMVGWY